MMVLAQKRQTLPLWLVISICFHLLMLLIPLFPQGTGGELSTVGEIELVEVEVQAPAAKLKLAVVD